MLEKKEARELFQISKLVRLDLGYQGENKARVIAIDMKAWLEEFPGAAVGLMLRRPDEDVFYPAALEMDDGIIEFEVTRADVAIAGEGEAQIILTNEDDVELRSRIVKTKISASMSGTEVEAPPPQATWVGEVLNAAAQAEAAVEKMPSIGENGNWYGWDAAAGEYVDTGKPSQGKNGTQATIKVGTVTTLAPGSKATVTNTGTETNAVLDFGIPRGYDGTGSGGSSGGSEGEDGGYYTPAVDEESGELTWAPSKAGMPAVEAANIKGPKGDIGTSVTITNIKESEEDGGTNEVNFSDGSTLRVKNGKTGTFDETHTQDASTITGGTFSGKVKGNAVAMETVDAAQLRDIYAGTADLTAGTSALPTGTLYFVYE